MTVLYVNKFIMWHNYVNMVYIKAEGLFDKYTVSWNGGMGALHTNMRAKLKGTLRKQGVSCVLGSSEGGYEPSDGCYD